MNRCARGADRTVRVLGAIASHIKNHGQSPTVREICVAIGYPDEHRVWDSINTLIEIGLVSWSADEFSAGEFEKRRPRGLKLLIGLKEPVRVPVIAEGVVPGSRWLEFTGTEDGSLYYVTESGRTECQIVRMWETDNS